MYYLFLAVLSCFDWAFSSRGERRLLFITLASFLVGPGLSSAWASVFAARGFWSAGSIVVAPRFSCSEACGVLPDQGSNLGPLRWRVGSYPLCHQGGPHTSLLRKSFCEQVMMCCVRGWLCSAWWGSTRHGLVLGPGVEPATPKWSQDRQWCKREEVLLF